MLPASKPRPHTQSLFLAVAVFLLALAPPADALDPGDVNASGVVNQVDAAMIRDHLMERTPLTGSALSRADANADGKVDLADTVWVQGHYSPALIAPNVIVVDSVTGLIALDWTSPTLTLSWTGGGPHGIDPGDILVGSGCGGFLCRVVSVVQNGTTLTIQTTGATLAEAVQNGQFGGGFVLVESAPEPPKSPAGAAGRPTLEWAPATPANRQRAQTATVDLSGTTVFNGPNLTVRIVEGSISFTPEVQLDACIEGFQLKYFHLFLSGRMDVRCVMRAEATNATSVNFTNPAWTLPLFPDIPISPAPVALFIGPIPVVLDLKGTVGPTLSVTLAAAMNAQSRVDMSVECGGGAELLNGQWRTLSLANATASGAIDEWGIDPFNVKVSYRAAIGLQFYKISGPFIKFGPYSKLVGRVKSSSEIDLLLYGGLDLALNLELKILGWLGLSYQVADYQILETELLRQTANRNPQPSSIEMVSVPAGTFTMGCRDDGDDLTYGGSDQLPRHSVTLSAYRIGKYEVTNGQYCQVLNWALPRGYLKNSTGGAYAGGDVYVAGGYLLLAVSDSHCQIEYSGGTFSWKSRTGSGSANCSMEKHPVVDVTWYGSVAFCNWLSEKEGLTPCYSLSTWALTVPYPNGYRLPTEAEWERAAAWDGSKHWIYSFVSDTLTGKNRCNYYDNASSTYVNPLGLTSYPYSSPVGWFNGSNVSPNGSVQTVNSPSSVGAYDMSGNVWEWCHDWYDSYSGEAMTDPVGPGSGTHRVVRGGGWLSVFYGCRSADRYGTNPAYGEFTGGFRLSRTQ